MKDISKPLKNLLIFFFPIADYYIDNKDFVVSRNTETKNEIIITTRWIIVVCPAIKQQKKKMLLNFYINTIIVGTEGLKIFIFYDIIHQCLSSAMFKANDLFTKNACVQCSLQTSTPNRWLMMGGPRSPITTICATRVPSCMPIMLQHQHQTEFLQQLIPLFKWKSAVGDKWAPKFIWLKQICFTKNITKLSLLFVLAWVVNFLACSNYKIFTFTGAKLKQW